SGRVSRIALVRFTTQCDVLFPREGGMAEMSADSEPAVGDAFQRAVLQLRPANANTDIGNSLHYASELLHRHGVPGNDQLIVLVQVGGGDPSRVGGLDVLEDYFSGLGSGVTTRVGTPGPEAAHPPVQQNLGSYVRRTLGIDPELRAEFARAADEARQLYADCL